MTTKLLDKGLEHGVPRRQLLLSCLLIHWSRLFLGQHDMTLCSRGDWRKPNLSAEWTGNSLSTPVTSGPRYVLGRIVRRRSRHVTGRLALS